MRSRDVYGWLARAVPVLVLVLVPALVLVLVPALVPMLDLPTLHHFRV